METRKKVRKRIVSLLLSAAMLMGILPQMAIPVWATEESGDTQGGDSVTTGSAINLETQVVEVTIGEGEPVSYATFKEAWVEVTKQATTQERHAIVKLLEDVTSEDTIWENGKIENYENFTTLDLNGFTIDRGLSNSVSMGCVILVTNGTLIIKDTSLDKTGTITGGNSYDNGGGIYANNSTLTISDVTITGNRAYQGGGIAAKDSSITISDVTITGNNADQGGGLYLDKTNYTIERATISNNTSTGYGGGIHMVNGNPFRNDPVKTDLTSFHISDSIIENNQATDEIMGRGAGIYVQYDNLEMNQVSIRGNVAKGGGGGIYSDHYYSGNKVILNNVQITNNQASGIGGGGLVVSNSSDGSFLMNGGEIKHNTANIGGGVRVSGYFSVKGKVDITDNFIERPNPESDYGDRSNVSLDQGRYITLAGSLKGSKIGVSCHSVNYIFTRGYNRDDYGNHTNWSPTNIFTADYPNTKVDDFVDYVKINDPTSGQAKIVTHTGYTVLYYVNVPIWRTFAAPPQYVAQGQDTTAAKTASLATPPGDGHVLVGWTTYKDGTGTFYAPGGVIPAQNSRVGLTLYAQWGKEGYTVVYDANGGTRQMANQRAEEGTDATLASNLFTRDGHVFTGWNTSADGTGTPYVDQGTIPSQSKNTTITLYAQWKEDTYTVAYDSNGGGGSIESQTTGVGETTRVASNTFTKADYTFTGWNTLADGKGTAYDADGIIPSQEKDTTITLYAQWKGPKYTVAYNANGGVGSMNNQTTDVGTGTRIAPNTFTREDHGFIGWNTSADGTGTKYAPGSIIPSRQKNVQITLYAQWEKSNYTVVYDSNGGLGSMNPQTTNMGTDTTIPSNVFTKEGYNFTGWNTSADGKGTAYDADGIIPSQEKDTTITLYAQWRGPKYTLAYNANGGAGSMDNQITDVGTGTRIAPNTFTREDYGFIGWNTSADGTGTKYTLGDTITSGEKNVTITLYAQWKKVSKAAFPKITKNNVRGTEVRVQNKEATSISVVAEVTDGGTLSYQWYKNNENVTTGGSPISAATTSSYAPQTDTLGTLYYYVVVTNTLEIGGKLTSTSNTCGMREEIVIPKAPVVYDITAKTGSVLEDVTLDIIKAKQYEDYKGTITPAEGYLLPRTIVVTIGGKIMVSGIDYIYDKETGSLTIYNVTAQPTVKAKGILIPPTIYTISFNTNGGSTVAPISGKYSTGVTLATPPTKADHTFTGWYKDTSFTTSYTETKFGNENITLYAKWEKTTFDITGKVVDEDEKPVGTATVKLMAGSRKVAEVKTDGEGKFTLTGVPAGTYNIVITKDGQTVTQVITVSTGNVTVGTITLPKGNTNSIVYVRPNTPDIVVDKLDEFFKTDPEFTQDDQNVVDSGGTVEIKLDVEKKDESGDNQAANVEDIKTAAANKKEIGMFLDLKVNKIVTPLNSNDPDSSKPEKPLKLIKLANILILNIPLPTELQGKNNYVIYRYHGSEVQEINERPNSDGEYIEVSGNKTSLILHTKKFSTYAIAYDPVTTPDNGGGSGDNGDSSNNGSSNNGDGGSSSKLPIITTEVKGEGHITISKDKKEATITPDAGYVISDVILDGKSVGARTKITFTDGKNHKIEAVFVKKIALPYYMEDGKRVYIGFSVLAIDHYDYIAPPGEIVEFRDNPKDFIDNTIAWAKPSIDFVTEREIFVGTQPQVFAPNEGMTRGMFVTVIGRLYERSYAKISSKNTFSDVGPEDYYVRYVGWAHENGIITGVGGNKFAPTAMVTREQMGAIMRNFAAFLGKADIPDKTLAYTDSAQISPWAIQGAKYCQETKVITGRDGGSFAPKSNATRAEVAAVIERFIKIIVK